MSKLDNQTFNEIVNFLIPHCANNNARAALVESVLYGCNVLEQIDWDGAVRPFTVHLVKTLLQFGHCEVDQPAIVTLLTRLKSQVGIEQQQQIDNILSQIPIDEIEIPQNDWNLPDISRAKHVFIAYSHQNLEIVQRITTDLLNAGIDVWIDHMGLRAGTPDWEETVRDAIRDADAVLYMASPAARKSKFVRGEMSIATANQKTIYAIWIDGSDWTDAVPLDLVIMQYINMRGKSYEHGLDKLIGELIGKTETQQPPQKILKKPSMFFVAIIVTIIVLFSIIMVFLTTRANDLDITPTPLQTPEVVVGIETEEVLLIQTPSPSPTTATPLPSDTPTETNTHTPTSTRDDMGVAIQRSQTEQAETITVIPTVVTFFIEYGGTYSSNPNNVAAEEWKFHANSGDIITITMQSSLFNTRLSLYREGELVAIQSTGATSTIGNLEITRSDAYTIVAQSIQETMSGNYTIILLQITPTAIPVPISTRPPVSASSTPSVAQLRCADTYGPHFQIGDRFFVPFGDGPTSVWEEPNDEPKVGDIYEGEEGIIVGGPVCVRGRDGNLVAWQVEADSGVIGWVSEGYAHSPVPWIAPIDAAATNNNTTPSTNVSLLMNGTGQTTQGRVTNGEFQIEYYCERYGYGDDINRNNNNWWCTRNGTRTYTLRQSDFNQICRDTYGVADAVARQDGSNPIPAFGWRCYG